MLVGTLTYRIIANTYSVSDVVWLSCMFEAMGEEVEA